jgi:hypothetical protein
MLHILDFFNPNSLKEAMERVRRRNAMRQAGMLGEGESAPTEDDDAAGGRPAGGGLRSAGYLVVLYVSIYIVEFC